MTTSRCDQASTSVIRIVAALVMNEQGKTLLVRKRGTSAFMQVGGKLLEGEHSFTALEREVEEELGCGVEAGSGSALGIYRAPAANEPGCTVRAELFWVKLAGLAQAQGEIEQVIWADPWAVDGLTLAPLTELYVMPLARHRASAPRHSVVSAT